MAVFIGRMAWLALQLQLQLQYPVRGSVHSGQTVVNLEVFPGLGFPVM
jgi:hypothetical protein